MLRVNRSDCATGGWREGRGGMHGVNVIRFKVGMWRKIILEED
jgi:hypothetical protein